MNLAEYIMKRIVTKYWWVLPCLLGLYSFVGAGLKKLLWAVEWNGKIIVLFLFLMLFVVLVLTIIALLTSWVGLLSRKQWRKFLISLLLLVVAYLLSLKPLSFLFSTDETFEVVEYQIPRDEQLEEVDIQEGEDVNQEWAKYWKTGYTN